MAVCLANLVAALVMLRSLTSSAPAPKREAPALATPRRAHDSGATPSHSQDRIDLPLSCSPAPTIPPRRFAATRRLLLSLPPHAGRPRLRDPPPAPVKEAAAAAVEEYKAPPLRLLDPPQEEEPYPDEMEAADPDFYRIGYARMMRAPTGSSSSRGPTAWASTPPGTSSRSAEPG
ncbi:hypothetical protein ZWY2020_021775 [Hordeum vulgare]|nr:hypothetical protein ZWY2020_021775 [Hordeum vulgare]